MFDYGIASPEQFYEIKHFLKIHKTYSANRNDIIFTIRDNQKLIGTARLLNIDEDNQTLWLRGLFIAPEWRHKGLASNLLEYLRQQLQETAKFKSIFAFAEPHLEQFYSNNHYRKIESNLLPEALQQRYINARQQGKKWLCLHIGIIE